jgi:hypothetical protein
VIGPGGERVGEGAGAAADFESLMTRTGEVGEEEGVVEAVVVQAVGIEVREAVEVASDLLNRQP